MYLSETVSQPYQHRSFQVHVGSFGLIPRAPLFGPRDIQKKGRVWSDSDLPSGPILISPSPYGWMFVQSKQGIRKGTKA